MASAVARILRNACPEFVRLALPRSTQGAVCSESRGDLSGRYMRELAELIDDRQISAAVAQQVIEDLFEPQAPGPARRVRLGVWRAYLKDRTGYIGPSVVDSRTCC